MRIKRHNLKRAMIWLSVALCFADTGLRSHAYCILLSCDSKHVAEASDACRDASELQTPCCGCQHSACPNEGIPTDADVLSHPRQASDDEASDQGMPVCPCPQNCWCRQTPQPQVLTDTAAWNQLQQQTVPSTAVVMPLVVDDAAFRSVSTVAPASLSNATDLCAILCRYLA